MTVDLSIPRTQRAALSYSKKTPTVVEEIPVVQPEALEPGQALVKVLYSGVCHSDLSVVNEEYRGFEEATPRPCIAGHEGTGLIVAINDPMSNLKIGDKVGIKYLIHTCNQCEDCMAGDDAICTQHKCSVFDLPGTFQQYAVSYTSQLTPIPDGLDMAAAAPILCAGLTVWRGLKHTNAQPGQWVAIPGAGGGLGTLAVQYAVYKGLNVIAIDSGDEKKTLLKAMGVRAFVDFKEATDLVTTVREATPDQRGPFAALVISPRMDAYQLAMEYIRPGGYVCGIGLPDGELKINLLDKVVQRKNFVTSYVGSRLDAIEALQIAADGKVSQPIAIEPLDAIQDVYDRMQAGSITGRVVLDLWK